MNIRNNIIIYGTILILGVLACLLTLNYSYAKLNAPIDFKVNSINTNYVRLSWQKMEAADGYELYMKNTITGKSYISRYDSKTTSVKRGNLTPGNNYIFRIRAYNYVLGKKVNGKFSKGKKLNTHIEGAPELKKMYSINSNKDGSYTLNISWNKSNNSSIDGYQFYIYNYKDKSKEIKTLNKKARKYSITNLSSYDKVKVKVRAYKGDNKKLYTNYSKAGIISIKKKKKTSSKKTTKIIIVGASKICQLKNKNLNYGKYNKNSTVFFVCKSGEGINWLKSTGNKQINNILKNNNPKNSNFKLVFQMGGNNLPTPNTKSEVQNVAEKYADFYNSNYSKWKKINPTVQVYAISLNPFSEKDAKNKGTKIKESSYKKGYKTNTKVKTFNSALKKSINKNIKYKDVYTYFKTGTGKKYFKTVDGAHYTNDTAQRVYNKLIDVIGA